MKWWESNKDQIAHEVIETVKSLQTEQNYRTEMNIKHARLYGNMDVLGLSAFEYTRSESNNIDNRVTVNIIQSCVDTSGAKIASKKPEPMFLTENGDFDAQVKAKKLNKYVNGMFYDLNTYATTARCFKDGGVFGSGLYHVYSMNGGIHGERVFPNEIIVDDEDAFYGTPRTLYRVKSIDKETLKAAFPKFTSEIEAAPAVRNQYDQISSRYSQRIQIVEAWHLAVCGEKNGKKEVLIPGKHVLVIEGATLVENEWKRDSYPFAKYDYNPRLYGYWGQGIAEILTGKQLEINKLLRNIQLAHYFCSTPIWMKELGSKVLDSHLNNRIGNILTYKGVRPTLETFRSVNPELYQHLMWLIQTCYEEVGISQLAASSKNPLGANASGKALSTFNDFETERFALIGQQWEQFHMDIGKLMIEEAKDLYKTQNVNLSVKAENGAFVEKIKFSDIDLEESKYVMKVFPVSSFSSTPAARFQEVTEGIQAGLIDPQDGIELLNFPDIQNKTNLKLARRKLVQDLMEKMVDEGTFEPAEPFMDLEYILNYGQNYYCQCKMNGVPDDRLELIRRFISQAELMLAGPEIEQDFTQGEVQEPLMDEMGLDEAAASPDMMGETDPLLEEEMLMDEAAMLEGEQLPPETI